MVDNPEQPHEDAEAVLDANIEFYRAFSNQDFAAMQKTWRASDELVCIHPGWDAIAGRAAILSSWKRIFDNSPGFVVSPVGSQDSVYDRA